MSDPTKIPDNPANPAPGAVAGNPASGSVIGWSLGKTCGGVASKRFLDVSAASRTKWSSIMWKRFDLARSIGCDGIEPAYNDAGAFTSGFTIKPEDSLSWYAEVAMQGHMRMLSTGMKGGDEDQLSGALDMGAGQFDWLMVERCGEFDTCDKEKPFIAVSKPVFAIEYNQTSDDCGAATPVAQLATAVCRHQLPASIADGLYKDVEFTSNVWAQCEPLP